MTIEEINEILKEASVPREELKRLSIEELKKLQFRLSDIEDFLALILKKIELYYNKIDEVIEEKEVEIEEEIFTRDDDDDYEDIDYN